MEITLTNEQKVTVAITPKTLGGKPAALDGAPKWSILAGDSATVVAAEDGLTAVVTSTETLGDTQVLVEADADLGTGIQSISDVLKVSVIGALAANLGITVGTPELK